MSEHWKHQSADLSAPILVGREREVTRLRRMLQRALNGHGGFVLVAGEAGIGKSTLVQCLHHDARNNGGLVLAGAAFDLTATPPYGPWLDLIRTYPEDEDLPALPGFMTNREAVAALGSQEELHRSALTFFQEVGQVRPLLLVLEDLHWSDQPSLELLRVIARAIARAPILLVATFRDDEITREHPLHQLLPALIRESNPERIELGPLDEAAILELTDRQFNLSASDQAALVSHLLVRAEGNPLYTSELLRMLEREKTLWEDSGTWHLGDITVDTVPSLVRQMVERRMTNLTEETYNALQLAAVLGQIVALERWEQVTEFPVGAAVEEALEAHLVVETPGSDGVAFRHALLRESIYKMISLPRRRDLHQQVAEVYLTQPLPEPEHVAWHLKKAGDPRAASWLILAAEQAEGRFAWDVAVQRYEEAISMLREQGDQDALLARILLRMGRLFRFSDQLRTVECLEEARHVALRCGDQVTAAFALFNIGAYERVSEGKQLRLDKMRNAIEALSNTDQDINSIGWWAVTRLSADLDPLATIRGTFALQLAWAGRPHEAISLATRYLPENWADDSVDIQEITERYPDPSNTDFYAGLVVAYSHVCLPEKSRIASHLHIHLVTMINFRPGLALQKNVVLIIEHFPYRTRDLKERASLLAFLEDRLSGAGESLSLRNETFGLDYCYLMTGQWDQLRSRIEDGMVPSISVLWHITLFTYARFAIYTGNTNWAHEIIQRLLPGGPDEAPENHIHPLPGEAHRLGALLALEQANYEDMRRWMIAHDEWMDWTGAVLGRSEGSLLWAKLHLAEGRFEIAWECAHEALSQAMSPELPLALIAAYRFLGQLATKAHEFEAAARSLHASLELAEQCALPYERALSMHAQAELEQAKRNPEIARTILADVRRIATDLGARPLLRSVKEMLGSRNSWHQDEPQFGLSQREFEVLQLLVSGMSDKDIAEELFISHRTVSHHVSAILRKLDVESRTAAAVRAAHWGIV